LDEYNTFIFDENAGLLIQMLINVSHHLASIMQRQAALSYGIFVTTGYRKGYVSIAQF